MTRAGVSRKIRLLLADDHPLFREGVAMSLSRARDVELVDSVEDALQLMAAIDAVRPDLVLTDLAMPGAHGMDFIRQMRNRHPDVRILVLSFHSADPYALRALEAGAHGYLSKDCRAEELLRAIRRVATGLLYISPTTAELLALKHGQLQHRSGHRSLSAREFEVFQLLADGHSVTDIANSLSVSVKTVSAHRGRVMDKLGVKNIAQLVRYAVERDLLQR